MNAHFRPQEPLPEEPPIVRIMRGLIATNEMLLARIEKRLRFGWLLLIWTLSLLGLNVTVMVLTAARHV